MSRRSHGLAPVLYVIGDESGSFKRGDWMVVGLLFLSNPSARRTELALLRRKHRFFNELKYSSTDKYRVPFAMDVLAWFFDNTDLEFRCIVKSGDEHDLTYYKGWRSLSPETVSYNFTYKELLRNNLPADPHRILLKVDEKSRHRHDNLLAYLKDGIPSVRSVIEASSHSDDLLQVIDLLVGCVHGDLKGQHEPLKRSLSDQFLRLAGCRTATDKPKNCTRSKVNVWRWRASLAKKRAAVRP